MKKDRIKRFITRLAAVFMMVTMTSLTAIAYDGEYDKVSEQISFNGYPVADLLTDLKVSNGKAQATIEYILAMYGTGYHRYKGSGECYGYAEQTRKLFGSKYKQTKIGKKASAANLKKYLKNCKPGTHVRFAAQKGGGGRAHSIAILKATKDGFWYTDGNYDYKNGIRIDFRTYYDQAYSCSGNGFKNIVWIRQPKGSLPTVTKTDVKTISSGRGKGTGIVWRPVRGAKSYTVYRSTSKNSGYKKIATTKNIHYTDKSKDLYGKVYYKVKAVKKKSSTSKPVAAAKRVGSPKVYVKENYDDESGKYRLEFNWDPVDGAVRYNVYRYDWNKDKLVLIKTVSDTHWEKTVDDVWYEYYFTAQAGSKKSESDPEGFY